MKYVKYLISFLLFLSISVCIGEFYQIHISEMPNNNFITFSSVEKRSTKEFYRNLVKTADKNDVIIYYANVDSNSNFTKTNVTIYYSDKKVCDFFENEYLINRGISKSIFLSNGMVEFKDLLESNTYISKDICFYLICDENNGKNFLDEIENEYEVDNYSFVNEKPSFYNSKAFYIQLVLWIIAYSILLVVNLYDIMLIQKEVAVRFSLGERKSALYVKKVSIDSVIYILSFILAFYGISKFTNSLFSHKLSILFFLGFLILNLLFSLILCKIDIKKAYTGNSLTKSILISSYAFKIITSILLVIVLGIGIGKTFQVYNLKNIEDTLTDFKEYNFIDMRYSVSNPNIEDENAVLKYKLQKEFFNNKGAVVQSEFIDFGKLSDGKEHKGIVCNKNTEDYLREVIPELKNKNFDSKMYVLIPEYKNYENDYNLIVDFAQPDLNGDKGYLFFHNYEIEIITYKPNVSIIAFNNTASSKVETYKNPIIYFSYLDESDLVIQNMYGTLAERKIADGGLYEDWIGGINSVSYDNCIMIKATDNELEVFARNNNFSLENDYFSKLNVYENYKQSLLRNEKILIMLYGLILIFLIMESILIGTVVKIEYNINAKELAVKKILGYSILQKNLKIFLLSIIVIVIGFIFSVILCSLLRIVTTILFLFLGCVMLSLIEILFIFYYIVKIESTQVVKILKGDSL